MTGFDPASGGSYLQRNDSGATLQTGAERTHLLMIRVDALPTGTEAIAAKDDGNPGFFMGGVYVSSLSYLQVKDSGIAALRAPLTAGDVGKVQIYIWRRSTSQGFSDLHVYSVADDWPRYVAEDTSVSNPTTSSQSFALGATRGDDIGGNEAESFTIIGYAQSTTVLTYAQMTTLAQACKAAGDIVPASFPGCTNAYQASTDHADSLARDTVGSDHLEVIEGTSALTLDTFTPEYRNDGNPLDLVILGIASNGDGRNTLASVPTSPTDYSASTSDAQLWVEGETTPSDLSPRGDNDWGPELSLLRELYSAGMTNILAYKRCVSGASVGTEFAPPSGTDYAGIISRLKDGTTSYPYPLPLWSQVRLRLVTVIGPEASADVEAVADAYATDMGAFADAIKQVDGMWKAASDYMIIATDIPGFSTRTYKSTVNAANASLSSSRSDFGVVGTTNALDNGDGDHFDEDWTIYVGSAVASVHATGTDTEAAAP